MSIPPQLIRVKRKRADEAPVTFLQFDSQGPKRHRSEINWVYQRRDAAAPAAATHSDRPVIHASGPDHGSQSPSARQQKQQASQPSLASAAPPLSAQTSQATQSGSAEPRRFHVSRSATRNQALHAGVSKKYRHAAAVFVEGGRKHKAPSRQGGVATAALQATQTGTVPSTPAHAPISTVEQRQLKRPGVAHRARDTPKDAPARQPLPASLTNRRSDQDMDRIAAEMNQWVLSDIGATIKSMEQEKKEPAKARFKPKPSSQRYHEHHPEPAPTMDQPQEPTDVAMMDVSEDEDGGDDGDDWIIDEYVRILANWVNWDVAPSDIGVLELDDDETTFFYGSLEDEEDALNGDDEDENGIPASCCHWSSTHIERPCSRHADESAAENHYSADYPEDEVESNDEYGRNPYSYRDGASDDEEYGYSSYGYSSYGDGADGGETELGADDEARMARMRAYLARLCVSSPSAPDH